MRRTVLGAHYGITGWLVQRMSAVIMTLFGVVLLSFILFHAPAGFAEWKMLFSHGWVKIGLLIFFICLSLHAWIGVRDILMDYVHAVGIRLMLETGVLLSLAAYVLWAWSILWGR